MFRTFAKKGPSKAAVKLRRCKNCSELEKNLHHDTRGRSKKIMAENRICITGLRHSKVPAVRAPLLSLFAACSWCVHPFSSLGLSRGNGIVMIVHELRRCLFSPSFCPDFKAALATFRCTRMSASVNASSQERQPHFAEVASLVLHLDSQRAACVT